MWVIMMGFINDPGGRTGAIAGTNAYDRSQRPEGIAGTGAAGAVGKVLKSSLIEGLGIKAGFNVNAQAG